MKAWGIFFACLALAFGCASGPKIEMVKEVPKDKPLYGVTREGIFFIHDAIIKNVQSEEPPCVVSEGTTKRKRPMKLVGEYWIYDIKESKLDQVSFDSYKKLLKIKYIFVVGPMRHLPEELMGGTDWVKEKDVVPDKKLKFMFLTEIGDFPEVKATP